MTSLLYILLYVLFIGTEAFYLPGVAPVAYCDDNKLDKNCQTDVPVFVNRLSSMRTGIPYKYEKFDLCTDETDPHSPAVNLGQDVFGDRFTSSPYKLTFKKDVSCQKVCEKTYTPGNKTSTEKLHFMRKSIELNYNQYWIVDNMPVTWCYLTADGSEYCSQAFPIGCYVTKQRKLKDSCVINLKFNAADTYYFFNHLDLTISYETGSKGGTYGRYDSGSRDWGSKGATYGRILSAKVVPKSVSYIGGASVGDEMCRSYTVMGIKGGKLEKETTIKYTYSVKWQESNAKWASRWDYILEPRSSNIHWFSIMNSLLIVCFLSAILAKIIWTNLYKDAATCCKSDKIAKQMAWKLVYGDIFRPPRGGKWLCVLVGSGVQILLTCFLTIVFAALGYLAPPNRGALGQCMLVIYVCLGTPAGYVSARLYKSLGGEKRKQNAVLTALFFPGIIFGLMLILNTVFSVEESSAALPATTLLTLLSLWLGVSVPLTFVGAFLGFRKKGIQHPVKTNAISRKIPNLRVFTRPLMGILIGGILPFGCVFIQAFFLLNNIWFYQVYYIFGFLLIVFVLLLITCCEVTIMLCYFHLCAEDYHWWWRSFLTSGFSAVYFYIYCIHYYLTKLDLQGVTSAVIYFGYMFIIALCLFLLTGTVGFFACFWFVQKIYRIVKGYEMWSTNGSEYKILE